VLQLVKLHGTKKWAQVGAELNGRTGKQVSVSFFSYFTSSTTRHRRPQCRSPSTF
jgi:hypothetical protein